MWHAEDSDHLQKEPTRVVCYHGVAVLGVTLPQISEDEDRVAVRIFGHQFAENEGDEVEAPDSERIEILLNGTEALELMFAIMAGYEGTYGPLRIPGGSVN